MTLTDSRPTKKKRFRWAKILLIIAVAFFLARLGNKVTEYYALADQAEQYRAELALAQQAYDEKQTTLELLDNPAYLERMAREKLGMVKAGETVVSLVETAASPPDALD